nr:MAG TPA: hypothetical protein [Bacteriophage sp.]
MSMSMGTENFDNVKNEIIDKFKIIGCQKTPSPLTHTMMKMEKKYHVILYKIYQKKCLSKV